MFVWSAGDVVRYNYFLKIDEFSAQLRYNVFLITYPLGLALEILNMYTGHVKETFNKYIINTITMLILIPLIVLSFQIRFRQLYNQRKIFYERKVKTQ